MLTVAMYNSNPALARGIKAVFKDLNEEFLFYEITTPNELLVHLGHRRMDAVLIVLNENKYLDVNIIKKNKSILWVIIYDDNAYKQALVYFINGARALISKTADLAEVAHCLDESIHGNIYICERTLRVFSYDILLDPNNRKFLNTFLGTAKKRWDLKLTTREKEVAALLLSGMKSSDIARRLNLKINTISTMKRSILTKYNAKSMIELARMI